MIKIKQTKTKQNNTQVEENRKMESLLPMGQNVMFWLCFPQHLLSIFEMMELLFSFKNNIFQLLVKVVE